MGRITLEVLKYQIKDVATSPLYHLLLWLIIFDIISGYIKAFKTKNFDSKISTNGWLKHGFVIMMITVIGVYARALNYGGVSQVVCLGFIGSYGMSLLENLDAIGVPYPENFRKFFKQMQDKDKVEMLKNGDIKIDVSKDDEIRIS
ncbi:MAG: phage holin family protein [Anaerococcus prevotii]|uniref:phage holin family protein n=1 Tax=Anaerococcus prevotii TaxID=33034 RepID=UPI0028FDFA16|nr:phage holin family protein [Anaerococcus prevotii]MDU2557409.1 phage holin family protein [Anaerococcus prevotii]